MAKVFLSYRKAYSKEVTSRIYDQLSRNFGKRCVIKDTESIYAGDDFKAVIEKYIKSCKVLLVIIGPEWLSEFEQKKKKKQIDYVKFELETALKFNLNIIPILINDATMPGKHQLPDSITPLAERHAIPIREDPDFKIDIKNLVEGIFRKVNRADRWRWRLFQFKYPIIAGILLLGLAVVLINLQIRINSSYFVKKMPIVKDPDNDGANQFYLKDDETYRSKSIEFIEKNNGRDSFYVTLLPGHKEGWFKAYHINRSTSKCPEYIVTYFINQDGFDHHEKKCIK